MIRIDAFKTRDGAIHETERAAKRHAEKVYGDALLRHARALSDIQHERGAYVRTAEYLDAHAAELAELAELRADRAVNDCPTCAGLLQPCTACANRAIRQENKA